MIDDRVIVVYYHHHTVFLVIIYRDYFHFDDARDDAVHVQYSIHSLRACKERRRP